MKKLIYFLLMLTLVFSCSKPLTPEQTRFQVVLEHLKEHYKESEYTYLYNDSTKELYGFVKGVNQDTKDANFISPLCYTDKSYCYYTEKGDQANGYIFEVYEVNPKDSLFELGDYLKVIILSEDNEVVWCGTDYPHKGCTGECVKKITNLEKCGFKSEPIPSNSGYDSIDTLDIEDILEK